MQHQHVTPAAAAGNTPPEQPRVRVTDYEPAAADFLREAIAGLCASPRTLPSKFFYDERGSDLFREICELPEYYITRTETALLEQYAGELAKSVGANAELVGFGTGAGVKTRMLLQSLENAIAYVPVDISKQRLIDSAHELSRVMPELEILPVVADYMQPFELPQPSRKPDHVAVYFPGSTIGNLQPASARDFLRRICALCGRDGGLIIGVDLEKPRDVLHAAYNDSAGVTAEFNRNLLVRANRELGADFVLECWQHRAIYNETEHRIEMHLVTEKAQTVRLGGREFHFDEGEKIISEYSYKHTIDGFTAMAVSAGFRRANVWTDPRQWFAVFHFVVA
jgi:dimethylhistidine N-methyltransferase